MISKIFKTLRYIFLLILLISLLLNFILKDSIWPLSFLFYALPIRIVIFFSVVYVILSINTKWHRVTSFLILLPLLFIEFDPSSGFIFNNLKPQLVTWNIGREKTSIDEIIKFVEKYNADIFLFIEFDRNSSKKNKIYIFEEKLRDYKIILLEGNKAILVKKSKKLNLIESLNDSKNFFTLADYNGLRYMFIDIESANTIDRPKAFEFLYEIVEKYNVDIICGDFNTPFNSIYMQKLLNNFNSGNSKEIYDRLTWPSCFPLLSIDNIFVKKNLIINDYRPDYSCQSDHLPLLINFSK